MGLDFDVLEFCKKLRLERPPPYQCPLEACDRVYKSLCGLQYHLVNYDHDNPTPMSPSVLAFKGRKGHRSQRAPVPTGDIALQSPPKEALTFAEAQKVVQFEIDGKISRVCIDRPLPVMSMEEWETRNAELEKPLLFAEPPPEPHVKLPEASYKLLPDYKLTEMPPRPNSYIRFIEKSAEELDGEVEYDVDEEDTAWLGLINKMRAKTGLPSVSVDTLELLMDRLEKESYFQAAQSGQQPAAVVDEEAVCCICTDGECQNTNVILFCDMCNLAVHQDCYGVPYIPEGQWLCRRCLQSPSRLVNCVLCPNTGGAFKQTDQGTWAHVVCALWIPEVRFANTVFLEPIDSIEMIPMARWKLQCTVCKRRGVGACIQCHKSNCYSAFHVTCAQQAGLYMKMDAVGGGRDPSQPVQVAKMAYCDAHTPAHVLQERRAMESEEGDSTKKVDLSVVRQKGREKMKHARRVLAMKRTWAPVVLVPTLAPERVAEIAQLAGGGSVAARAQLLKRLLAYWSLKRRHRNGVPLLRRLQSLQTHHGGRGAIQDGAVNTRELCNQLKYWQRIRQDLERARLLCELVRKRERMKAEYTRVWERCLMHSLRPERAALHKLLRQLHSRDTSDIFSEPVDPTEVPDYSTVVKRPMDLSTMESRLERGEYTTVDDIQADFSLMIDNCLAYNNKDTVFYKNGRNITFQWVPSHVGVVGNEQADLMAKDACRSDGITTICKPFWTDILLDIRRKEGNLLCGRNTLKNISPERAGVKMREQCAPLLRGARRDLRSAGLPHVAGTGSRESSVESQPSVDSQPPVGAARSRRGRSMSRARERSPPSPPSPPPRRAASVARRTRDKWATDTDDDTPERARSVERAPVVKAVMREGEPRRRGRGRGRGRWRGRGRGRPLSTQQRPAKKSATETATSESEAPAPPRSPARSPAKSPAKSPSKSPVKPSENQALGLSILGSRKSSLALPLTPPTMPSKSFGSDLKLPTLSASLTQTPEAPPKKKGRGRPRKHDKPKPPVPDKFSSLGEGGVEGNTPVPASFLQYRGPKGEACSDSDVARSRSSSSSSAWSCSSCTHYDDDISDHSCSSSSTGGRSSYNETLDSNTNQTMSDTESRAGTTRRGRPPSSAAHKARGTRSASKTPTKSAGSEGTGSGLIPPLSLVWAKCRGYPWYPALIIDPKMPKGFVYNGVPLPVPPQDVINLKRNITNDSVLHLVLFFDAKRTWQWLPKNKLEPLGLEKSVDQSKLIESRKPTDRKAVKKAYGDAMHFRKQVDGETGK